MMEHSHLAGPPRFLTDKNFNWRILAGLRRQQPMADVVTTQDLGLDEVPDPELLLRAKALDRIVLTHDVNTMPKYFDELLAALPDGEHSPGIMLMPQQLPIGMAITALVEVWACSLHTEWQDLRTFLPL